MIDIKNVTKYYDDFCAVNNISLSIQKGEITGLLGPNGAGKTTTMRMITGYLEASSGDILIGGLDVKTTPVEVKKMIGYLPESAPIYDDMFVFDYLKYIAEIHNITNEDRIKETAEFCGLIEVMHKNINELSKGYKQRVGLAHALIHDPEILILDEPTTGLDPNQIIEIRNLIKKIGKEKTVILSTHILPEVEATCDRIIIISEGNIVADNETSELQNIHGKNQLVEVKVKGPSFDELANAVRTIESVSDFVEIEKSEDLVSGVIKTNDKADIRPDIFKLICDKNWILYEMVQQQNTLERIFIDLTLGGKNE